MYWGYAGSTRDMRDMESVLGSRRIWTIYWEFTGNEGYTGICGGCKHSYTVKVRRVPPADLTE